MTCPKYQGKNQCGFHSAYFVLIDQHVKEYCTTDRFQSCSEIEKFAKNQIPLNVEQAHVPVYDVRQLTKSTQELLELAQKVQKISPIHTSEGVLGMGSSDDEDHYGHYNEECE